MERSAPMGELGGATRLEPHVAGGSLESIRVLCFNVRHCRGAFSVFISEERTARVIQSLQPDVAGLTELYKTARRDQPARLSRLVGLQSRFHGVRPVAGGEYGNALLARSAPLEVRRIELGGRREARGCLVAEVATGVGTVTTAVTHLGLDAKTRKEQIAELVRTLPRERPLILMGDFNSRPRELEPLLAFLETVPGPPLTFPSVLPVAPLDRVLFSHDFMLRAASAPFALASDHRPLIVELALSGHPESV